jgi:hypothetical protein
MRAGPAFFALVQGENIDPALFGPHLASIAVKPPNIAVE